MGDLLMNIRRNARRPARKNKLVKMNMEKFAGRRLGNLLRNAGWAKLGLLCLAGWMINAAQAQPANDNFANAFVITNMAGTTNGSNVGATMQDLTGCELTYIMGDDYADIDNSVWFAWTAPVSGLAEFDTIGSDPDFDTVLAVFTTPTDLCDPSIAYVAENDDINPGVNIASQVSFYAVAGTTYYISVNGNADTGPPYDSGNYVLNWNEQAAPPNDYFTNAFVITGYSGSTNGTTVGATLENCEPSFIMTGNSLTNIVDLDDSVWFAWTAPVSGTAEFDTIGSAFNTVLAVYTTTNGLCDPNLTYIAGNDDITNGVQTNSQVFFQAVGGTTYYISVNGNADVGPPYDSGSYVFNWNLTTIPSGTLGFAFPGNYGNNSIYGLGGLLGNVYTVSELDSSGVTGVNVADTVNGARITVTRPAPANGRILVDYQVTGVSFTDTLTTNTYGTNTYVTIINTNGVTTQVNSFYTNTVFNNQIGYYYDGLVEYYPNTGAKTNYMVVSNGATMFRRNGTSNATNEDVPNFTYYTANTVTNIVLYPSVYNLTNYYSVNYVFDVTNITDLYQIGPPQTYSVTNVLPPTPSAPYDVVNLVLGTEISGVSSTNETDITNYFISPFGPVGSDFTNISVLDPSSTSWTTNSLDVYTNNAAYTTITSTTLFSYMFTTNVTRLNTAGFTPTTNTLVFDDFQMSADFYIPVFQSSTGGGNGGGGFGGFGGFGGNNGIGLAGLPNVAAISLSNPRLDPLESSDLQPPTLNPLTSTGLVSILSTTYVDGDTIPAANSIFNWERSTFRTWSDEGSVTVYVDRTGGNANQAVSVQYDTDYNGNNNNDNTFPLQPGSDYATPGVDFTTTGGTLNWAANKANAQAVTIPILNASLAEFNEDVLLVLHDPGKYGELGEVYDATLTILNYYGEPAGALDRSWNADNSSGSVPPFIPYPGTAGAGSTVYAVAEQPNGSAIIAGSFNSYDEAPYNRIVRVGNNGYVDTSFLASPNSGANDFIAALALQPDGNILIGGNFTAFNGNNRHYIARLNGADGSLDTTFNPGLGANGTVWSIALETNVQTFVELPLTNVISLTNYQVIIAGDFTTVNGIQLNHVARLNMDGSVDTSFNPGVGPDGSVNVVTVDSLGRVLIGGNFDTVSGVVSGGIARLNVDGSVDTTFAPGIGTYNPDSLATDPVNAIVLQADGQILVAGGFAYMDLDSYSGIVRLNTDGTLDLSFNPGTGTLNLNTSLSDSIYAMTLQPDGTIFVAGDFTTFNQTRRVGLARLLTDGTLDTSFMDTAYNQYAGLINHYHNPNAVNPSLYPETNTRNYVYALAAEKWTYNVVTNVTLTTNKTVVTTNRTTTTTAIPGNIIIGGSFYYLGSGGGWDNSTLTREDTHPRSNVARILGGSTPGPGNIEFAYNSYTWDKPPGLTNSQSAEITLVRNNGSLGMINATFATNTAAPGPGIAVPDVDFSLDPLYASPGWPTEWPLPAWTYRTGYTGPEYVPVTIYNDGRITGNLNANLILSNPNSTNFLLGGEFIPLGSALGTMTEEPLKIIDINTSPGVLGFSSPAYSVTSDGGTATITVTRTGGSDGVVQVGYITSDGTASNHLDYSSVTNTLTFGGGVTSQTFTIPIIKVTVAQPDKTVNLRLNTPAGGATLGQSNAVLTIINSVFTPGHLGFTSATFATNENSGVAIVGVNRLGGNSGTLSVEVLTSDGTAVNGVNYTGSTNVLVWNDGDASTKTVVIPVMDDGVVTSNLTVNLQLAYATNYTTVSTNTNPDLLALSDFTNATLFIDNVDSAGTVQFGSPVYSVKKSGGFALIPVVRTGGTVGTVTVGFGTANGTAVAGANYVATNGVMTFTNGQVGKFFAVPVIDNGVSNGLKTLSLLLTNASPATALGNPSNAVLNIIDTDSVNEPPGSGDVTYDALGLNNTVYALALQTNNQLVVGGDFTLANGLPRYRIARFNSDGSVDPGFSKASDTWGASDSVRAIALQADGHILAGGLFTNFNSVVMNYIARLNSDGSLDSYFSPGSGPDNAVYALTETFVGGQSKILLGGTFASISGTPINAIARLNSDGSLDTAFNPGLGANGTVYALAVQPSDGKVVIGGDFTAVNGNTNYAHIARLNTDGSLDTNFVASASDSVHAIAIQLDGEIIIGGLFTSVNGVALNHIARLNTDGSLDTAFQPGVGADDAVFSIALQSDNRIVVGGEFARFSGVSRSRITRLNPDGTVDPTINFGTGANDFVAAIAIQDDTIYGYPTSVPDEKIIIGGGFTQYNGQPHAHLARIYGGSVGGVGAFEFSSANYSVDENGTNVVITILRTGGTSGANADGSGDIIVPFTTSDGSARAGVNYTAVTNNLDFPMGEVIQTVTIPVMDDGVITTNLTVNLALNPSPPAAFGGQPLATLTIINDDSEINFAYSTYTVSKDNIAGAATINILRQGGVSGTSTVFFSTTSAGSAVPVTDYTPVSQTVVFSPGVSNVAVTVPINNNGLPEGNRTVGMQLTGATGSLLYSPSNAVLTIIDTLHTPGQLAFSAPNYVITEGGGAGTTNAYITIIRTNGSKNAVTVAYSTADGTALAGVKYIPTNGTVSFGDGEMGAKTFAVQVINTTTAEGPEYLNLVLTTNASSNGATLADPSTATLTILNTNIGVAFDSPLYTTTEPAPFAVVSNAITLNVLRFNTTNVQTTVSYATADGTAVAGTNYVATNGVVTFNPGETLKTIVVPLLYDPLVTGDLAFTVILSNPSGTAQLTPPSTATVLVHDADAGLSFSAAAMSVAKSAGFAYLYVLCSNPAVEPVSVNYFTSPGTAQPGVDYTATSGTLKLTNGAAIGTIVVPLVANNLAQSTNRSFTVSLSNPTPPGQLLPPTTETVTIIETNTPHGLSFFSPIILNGDWGATNANNTAGSPDYGTPNIATYAPNAPVWFQWTAPSSGEVSLDTIGSLQTNGLKADTVLAVFTGSVLSGLNQVAANDDLYPLPYPPTYGQYNEAAQNIYNVNGVNIGVTNVLGGGGLGGGGGGGGGGLITTAVPVFSGELYEFYQPFGGPSGLRFNATAGTTYYFVVDTKPNYSLTLLTNINFLNLTNLLDYYQETDIGRGTISLNWAYHPSGVFRFASENVDQTGIVGTNGSPMLLYQCSETETSRRISGAVNAGEYDGTIGTYWDYDAPGLLVTVTRVAGSSGRMAVDYTTMDGDASVTTNGDLAAVADTDYYPVSGTLVFDDYEMSKTILIQIIDDDGVAQPNRDFKVVLSNPRPDPAESPDVSAPRVDPIFNQVVCRILDCDIDPSFGTSVTYNMVTNVDPILMVTNVLTNAVYNLTPTNSVFNFQKTSYRVARDQDANGREYWGTPVGIYVNRIATTAAEYANEAKVNYVIDGYFLDSTEVEYNNYVFPLQPGSDYATPPGGTDVGGIFQSKNSDFNPSGGASGTLDFPAKKLTPQPILFNVTDNNLTEFNEDFHIVIFEEDKDGNPYQCGMVDECNVTILFDDLNPPAGSVDEYWNPDFSDAMLLNQNGSLVANPGTEALSEVYALAVTPNDQTVIGGAFSTYSDKNNTYTMSGIARLNKDGSLDTSFNPGVGVNVHPGNEFIRSLALSGNRVIVGGHFTSFNGVPRSNIARLNNDGSLDTSFNPGTGANGTVWSILTQPDGKVMIGGDFTSYNGTTRNHVARLNTDGSLDTTFDPSNTLSGPVYSMALGSVYYTFARQQAGITNEDDQAIPLVNNLGNFTSGTLTVTYNFLAMSNDMQVYYGDTNVAGGTGVLLYDTGYNTNGPVTFALNYGPVGGLTASQITIVMNPGGITNGIATSWSYTATLGTPQSLVVGGQFNVAGQTYANLARMDLTGSLDTSFNPGSGPDNAVWALNYQSNGQIVAGGAFTHVNGSSYNRLVRLNADGTLDANFYVGVGADNTIYSIMQSLAGGQLYLGGTFTTFNGTHRLGFARLNANGTVDTTFMDTAYNQFAGLTRIHYGDPPGTVYSAGLQSDGNVMIAGSFAQVGGGQFSEDVRPGDYTLDPNLGVYLNQNVWPEPKTREGIRNRGNVARLIGGATPGPGNIGFTAPSYAANKSQSFESVTLTRTNGFLGYASANFTVQPSLAVNGVDYSYGGTAPIYPICWEYSGPSRIHGDGMVGGNSLMTEGLGQFTESFGLTGPAAVIVSLINDTSSQGNLSAQFQMANPNADMFYLGGQLIPVGVALGEPAAPFTIVDNSHQDGVFGFTAPSYTATSSPATIGIGRAVSSYGSVQLSYQTTTGGTAVPGVDYQSAAGVVTFNPGQTSAAFPVTILNNSYISSVEKTVGLQLNSLQDLSYGNASLGLTNAVLRIINPNYQGYVGFVTNFQSANLSAGVMAVTVSRTVGSLGSLTVQYATTNGTAVSGVDFVGSTNTLSWNSGDVTPRVILIPLINNNQIGPDKQFGAGLFNPTTNGVSAPALFGAFTNTGLLIVNDNSYGTFQFSAPSYLVNENGGYATVTVTRTGSAVSNATVNFATADGTAFAGTNYVATNGVLSFAPGQLAESFAVRILDDGVTNPPVGSFFFNVELSNPSAGASLGSPANALVQIVDAETYNQPAGSPDVAFSPTAGMNDSVLALALQSDGQIVAGGNFTIANGAALNHLVRLNTDGTLDTGYLNGLAGANGPVNALVSQTDDRVVIGGAFTSVDNITRYRIARLMTDGSLDTSFNPGSGVDNSVFALAETFIGGSRAIYVGGAFTTVNGQSLPALARLNDNGLVDSTFNPGLGANGTVYAVAPYPAGSIYNAGQVLVGGAFSNFNNYAVGNLVRLNVDGSMDTNFIANMGANGTVRALAIQLDGGILIGGDFTSVNGTALGHVARLNPDGTVDAAFAANVASSVNGVVNAISVQADNRIVLAGDFTSANGVTRHSITRLMPDGTVDPTINFGDGANGAINALVIQPADGMLVIGGGFTQFNDQPHDHIARLYGGSMTGSGAFQFSSPGYSANENSGFAYVVVRRTGGTSGPNADGSGDVYIQFATSDGSAVAGINYNTVITNVDFPMGEVLQTIQIPVLDDGVITSNLTVNLALSNPTPPAGVGNQTTSVLTIINVDSAVSFSSVNYSVPKDTANGAGMINVVRQGSTVGGCTVVFSTTTNGTAVAGVDYYPTNVTVTFAAGDSSKTVQVPVINNAIPEGNRTVTMQLAGATGTAVYAPSNAVLTIIDTVYAPGQLSFATNNVFVVKGNTNVYLTVVRADGSSGAVTVDYTTVPGTATPSLNYQTTSGTLTLNDGATSNTIAIQIEDNNVVQGPVNFSVQLSNPSGGAVLAVPTNSLVTILEKNIGLAFTAATNAVSETAGFVALNVERLYGITNVTTVHFATTNGSAQANVNYYATSGTLTFNPGESVKPVVVPLIYDTNVTGNLTFTVGLSSPAAPAQLMAPSFTTVVIQDADAGLSFTNAAMNVLKSAGSAVITVVCSNPNVEPVIVDSNTVPLSVNYATSDGTAVAGQNYVATSGTLVFTNGIATNTFTVPIINDGNVTGDKTFNVTLSSPTPPGQLVPPSTQTVTIIDSNSGLEFSSPTYTVLKTGLAATIDVFRTGFTDGVVSVNYTATNGTAIPGLDYVPASGTLVFTNGVTDQSFMVQVIDNPAVQPDKTVLLQLLSPVNGILLAPSAATLTIHDNTGSYVVPAGSRLVSETGAGAPNGVIDSNETVTILIALRDAGGNNAADVKATLLATNGITSPFANLTTSPPTQDYGELDYHGHSVFREFTFTAQGTNGQQIVATFLLTNVVNNIATNIGTAVFGYTLGSWTATYSNTALIEIPDNIYTSAEGPANPYPSVINVSGVSGTVVKTTITWTNVTHTSPSDIDALLVSPSQYDVLFMSHAGGNYGMYNVTLKFDDAATNSLPQDATITNGVYLPTSYLPVPVFP